MKYLKISLLLGLIFMVSVQPLVMIGMLLGLVIFYSLNIYYFSMSFWFGYILMLILLSGILVIFTYIVSLIPNENFEYMSFFLIFSFFFMLFTDILYLLGDDQSVFGILLWGGVMWGYLIFLGIFLLSIMVMVVFLSDPMEGALRLLCAW